MNYKTILNSIFIIFYVKVTPLVQHGIGFYTPQRIAYHLTTIMVLEVKASLKVLWCDIQSVSNWHA